MSLSRTHIAYGIGLGLIVLNSRVMIVDLKEYIPGLVAGACLPDIDTKKSWAAQTIPLIDDKLRDFKVFEHRGITHGIIRRKDRSANYAGILLLAFIFYILFRMYPNDLMIGIILGYFSHISLDIFDEIIEITCKVDDRMFKIGWIINTFLIINYIVGLDILYFILINILSNDNGIYFFVGIIIFILTIIIIIFKYLKSEVKSSKTIKARTTRKTAKSKGR